jgi:hypothetical protein
MYLQLYNRADRSYSVTAFRPNYLFLFFARNVSDATAGKLSWVVGSRIGSQCEMIAEWQ